MAECDAALTWIRLAFKIQDALEHQILVQKPDRVMAVDPTDVFATSYGLTITSQHRKTTERYEKYINYMRFRFILFILVFPVPIRVPLNADTYSEIITY